MWRHLVAVIETILDFFSFFMVVGAFLLDKYCGSDPLDGGIHWTYLSNYSKKVPLLSHLLFHSVFLIPVLLNKRQLMKQNWDWKNRMKTAGDSWLT